MGLVVLLRRDQSSLARSWQDRIFATYPAETESFLRRGQNRFTNPVGATFCSETEALLGRLLAGDEPEELREHLEKIVKIRSLQVSSASEAVSFVYLLKKTIRERLCGEPRDAQLLEELLQLETRIDRLALVAFDVHMECREKLCEIRVNEAKRSVGGLLRRLNREQSGPSPEPTVLGGDTP